MDHVGQGEQEGTVMSHRCESLSAPDLLSQNLNLSPSNALSLEEDRDGAGLHTGLSVNDNGHLQEDRELGGDEEEEEEEDTDALMKEEDDESEASSLVHCQSPGTPMTDSSYSDTGSLLETPFSPATSPEPPFPLGPEELSRCDGDVLSNTASTCERSGRTSTPQPSTSPAVRSDGPAQLSTVPAPSAAAAPASDPSSEPPDSLDQLAEDGDDAQLPQRLHQMAEAFVRRGDYQQAFCCIHLERLYHQRVLENLHALQELWERRCGGASFSVETKPLEALQELCRTHSRPRLTHALFPLMESLRPKLEEGGAARPCPAEQRPGDSSWTCHAVTEDLHVCEGGRAEVEEATSGSDLVLPPSTAGEVDRQHGGDSGQAEGREDEAEEGEEEQEEEEEEEERSVEDVSGELEVETLVSRTDEEEEIRRGPEGQPPSPLGQQLEEEYELESADVMRGAATLDDLAKLITVEELSPASGLVSILKRRSVCEDDVGVSPEPDKPPPKRRVRFKVSDDGYESEVGGGDSCLLLFLLCLVTVVVSVGGTALYCALGDPHSSVCQDFSRNLDFYVSQSQRIVSQIQHWFLSGSS